MTAARAVVFAYHDVGVRCLKVLLSGGVEVPLVVTVADDPRETRWFASVADAAADYGIATIKPQDVNSSEVVSRISALQPDFVFSFYYRSMLGAGLLHAARRGALNMHGSMLPRYRGRAPVNWAILQGERETGATLHYMVDRADAGDIVDQFAVPILEDDDAREVFGKVTVAAELVLSRSLPGLLAGTAPRRPQPLLPGQYFGRRRPEDGRIDWSQPARRIHDLVRAVAPPFPGAFASVGTERWWIHKTRVAAAGGAKRERARLCGSQAGCWVECVDGGTLHLLRAATDHGVIDLPARGVALRERPVLLV